MKTVLIFAILFIVFTVIGTLTHELGHYSAGKSLGLNCTLHYASCRCLYDAQEERNNYRKMLSNNYENRDLIPAELWDKYQELVEKATPKKNRLWVTVGGPLQTILTGTIGFLLLVMRSQKNKIQFQKFDWLLVFLSLFWLREPFNLFFVAAQNLILGGDSYFGSTGDEVKISRGLNLWDGTVPIVLGVIGLVISLIVIFKFVPISKRKSLIWGGLIGGISGFILWMIIIGPIVLPIK